MDDRSPRPEPPSGDDSPDAPTTEYAANQEPGRGPDEGYVAGGDEGGTAADLDPHEPPGQG
jgi:hypothetical protein